MSNPQKRALQGSEPAEGRKKNPDGGSSECSVSSFPHGNDPGMVSLAMEPGSCSPENGDPGFSGGVLLA